MSQDEQEKSSTLTSSVVWIIGSLIVAAIVGMYAFTKKVDESLNTIQVTQARTEGKIDMLTEKAREIVPRSENEMRFNNLEKGQTANAERIGKTEQYLLNKAAK